MVFTLPPGEYRFRADYNGTQFWSGSANHCTLPGCETAAVTVTLPVTVTVAGENGDPCPDLDVYAFDGETYTGFHGVSDENGQVVFTLSEGDYRFRADYDGVQFWSNTSDHCAVPGCAEAGVAVPGGLGHEEVTIDYTYDPLNRLTAADYASSQGSEVDGEYFHYQYDAVGNRLQLDSSQDGVVTYQYDAANRLIEAGGVSYTWDNNGNLLSDGTSTYTYNHANRLAGVTQDGVAYSYAYNGMGDRLHQSVDGVTTNYTLDLNVGLTQVLADGTNTYLYGRGRIAHVSAGSPQYFLGDALGSVRQVVDPAAEAVLTQSYQPYGGVLSQHGGSGTPYGFTGEWADQTELVYLRTRYYNPASGRLNSRDVWDGNINNPSTYNKWVYARNNPVMFTDPSGQICLDPWAPSGFHLDPSRGCGYPNVSSEGPPPEPPPSPVIETTFVGTPTPSMGQDISKKCGINGAIRGDQVVDVYKAKRIPHPERTPVPSLFNMKGGSLRNEFDWYELQLGCLQLGGDSEYNCLAYLSLMKYIELEIDVVYYAYNLIDNPLPEEEILEYLRYKTISNSSDLIFGRFVGRLGMTKEHAVNFEPGFLTVLVHINQGVYQFVKEEALAEAEDVETLETLIWGRQKSSFSLQLIFLN